MKVILTQEEIGLAIIDYLKQRGIDTGLDKIYIRVETIPGGQRVYTADIVNVQLPPKEGPYR